MHSLPSLPGTYALHLYMKQAQTLTVGKLGMHTFPAGHYTYLGSAHGPGGLRSRLTRHILGTGKRHWHIDYLRSITQVKGVHHVTQSQSHSQRRLQPSPNPPLECCWSQALIALPQAYPPIQRFGASDCRLNCPAHLVAFEGITHLQFGDLLAQALDGFGWEIFYSPLNLALHSRPDLLE